MGGDRSGTAPAPRHASPWPALSRPFDEHLSDFLGGWAEVQQRTEYPAIDPTGSNEYHLYRFSHNVLLTHEDKLFSGALVASLSIPWGDTRGDQDGGYHLVWPRDMCNSATALLAAGQTTSALRALIFLACSQQDGGLFYQNFYVDGEPYWRGIQLDEIAFPIMLAYRLDRLNALRDFDPMPMVVQAAGTLIALGPKTSQERWEENDGYSPSTLASNIAALICAATLTRERLDDSVTPDFLEQYADFLETKLEEWTVTKQGKLLPEVTRHYVRISNAESPGRSPDPDP